MEEIEDSITLNNNSVPYFTSTIQSTQPQTIIQVSGNNGDILWSVKPDGEFVPGPGIDKNQALNEFSKFIYKNITIFGSSLSETLNKKNEKIRELEEEVRILKSKSQWDMK